MRIGNMIFCYIQSQVQGSLFPFLFLPSECIKNVRFKVKKVPHHPFHSVNFLPSRYQTVTWIKRENIKRQEIQKHEVLSNWIIIIYRTETWKGGRKRFRDSFKYILTANKRGMKEGVRKGNVSMNFPCIERNFLIQKVQTNFLQLLFLYSQTFWCNMINVLTSHSPWLFKIQLQTCLCSHPFNRCSVSIKILGHKKVDTIFCSLEMFNTCQQSLQMFDVTFSFLSPR